MTISKAEKARRAAARAADAANADAPPASSETKIEAPVVLAGKGTGGIKETNSGTAYIVCKMPRGLYLQLFQKVPQDVRVMGGGIEKRTAAMRVGPQHRLRPTVLPFGTIPNYPIVAGFSITEVPADFWREYARDNAQLSMITEGLVRGFDTEADARAYCREYSALKHGLEPMKQTGDPRLESIGNPNVSSIDIDSDAPPARG